LIAEHRVRGFVLPPQNNALERTRRVGVPAARAVVGAPPCRSTRCSAGRAAMQRHERTWHSLGRIAAWASLLVLAPAESHAAGSIPFTPGFGLPFLLAAATAGLVEALWLGRTSARPMAVAGVMGTKLLSALVLAIAYLALWGAFFEGAHPWLSAGDRWAVLPLDPVMLVVAITAFAATQRAAVILLTPQSSNAVAWRSVFRISIASQVWSLLVFVGAVNGWIQL
jgi:hypothetical protein